MATKQCTGPCGEIKDLEDFGKDRTRPDGRKAKCRGCYNAAASEYRHEHPTKYHEAYKTWATKNPDAVNASRRRLATTNPKKAASNRRKAHLWERYRITPDDFDALFAEQGGVCKICCEPETVTCNGKVRHLAVDHCHETNTVRGLLCGHCNRAIGLLQDNPELCDSAAAYLRATSSVDCPPDLQEAVQP